MGPGTDLGGRERGHLGRSRGKGKIIAANERRSHVEMLLLLPRWQGPHPGITEIEGSLCQRTLSHRPTVDDEDSEIYFAPGSQSPLEMSLFLFSH